MSFGEDCFAELGQERVLSINIDSLRESFQMKSKEAHPDSGGKGMNFDRLNHAHSVLSDPYKRVEHLYELLFTDTIDYSGSLSSLTMDLFGAIEPVVSRADTLIKQKSLATTGIKQALIARESIEVQRALIEANGIIRKRIQEIVDSFGSIDESLRSDKESARNIMQVVASDLAFLRKWEHEVTMRMRSLI
jgi:curved DNA-binding protein CbpA